MAERDDPEHQNRATPGPATRSGPPGGPSTSPRDLQATGPAPPDPTESQIDAALEDLRRRWRQGDRTDPNEALKHHAELADNPEAVAALIYQDYVLREQSGEAPDFEESLRRHPELAVRLRMLRDADRVVSGLARIGGRPDHFGDYVLLEEVARGGMGIVYRALQRSLRREVALKMIKAGPLATPDDVRRFLREAEAAADLQHPNIVAVHEVGSHTGQPYFAMDFVSGRTLAEIARDGPLPAPRAAGYVRTIAAAIHYAHGRGTLHRDLKPANVLIDDEDRPRVTDFGLARRPVDGDGSTPNGRVLGTPGYIPPEQAAGRWDEVGPASDVYALGAILYELLTARPPFRAETPAEALRQVLDVDPIPPRVLNRSVPVDLEAICLKCLEKAPKRRYAGADSLAEDLGRFLSGEPIRARPMGAFGRILRRARRRPGLATLAASLVMAVLLGFAGITWQWARAERSNRELSAANERLRLLNQELAESNRRAGKARDRAEDRLDLALEAIGNFRLAVDENLDTEEGPGPRALRARLLEEPLAFYRRLREDIRDDGESGLSSRTKLARATVELAMITAEIDSQAHAIAAFREGIDLLESVIPEVPDPDEHRGMLARSLRELALLLGAVGQRDEAERHLERARDLQEALLAGSPGCLTRRIDLARTLDRIGLLHLRVHPEQAQVHLERAIALLEPPTDGAQLPAEARGVQALALNHLGMLLRALGRTGEAISTYERAIAALESVAHEAPDEPDHLALLAGVVYNLGNAQLSASDGSEAKASFERARDLQEALVREYPAAGRHRADLARSLGNLAVIQGIGRPEEARATFERLLHVQGDLLRENPDVNAFRRDLALTHINLASHLFSDTRFNDALGHSLAARDLLDAALRSDGSVPDALYALGVASIEVGHSLASLGRSEEALAAYRGAIDRLLPSPGEAPEPGPVRGLLIQAHHRLAEAHRARGEPEAAAGAMQALQSLWVSDPEEMVAIARELALCAAIAPREEPATPCDPTFADRAMAALHLAIRAGFADTGRLRSDPAFAPLLSRPDLAARLQDLAFPSDPFAH